MSSVAFILVPEKGTIHSIINNKGKKHFFFLAPRVNPPFPFQYLYKSLQSEGGAHAPQVAQTRERLPFETELAWRKRMGKIKISSPPFCSPSVSFCWNFQNPSDCVLTFLCSHTFHLPQTHTYSLIVFPSLVHPFPFFSSSDFPQPYQPVSSK